VNRVECKYNYQSPASKVCLHVLSWASTAHHK